MDTRVYAAYSNLHARGHSAAEIPVKWAEEPGCQGRHHVSSDSSPASGGPEVVLAFSGCRADGSLDLTP